MTVWLFFESIIGNIPFVESGRLYSWGCNVHGQLGLGNNTTAQSVPVEVNGMKDIHSIHLGCQHSNIITSMWIDSFEMIFDIDTTFLSIDNAELFTCGSNVYGQLGLGHNSNVSVFTAVPDVNRITYCWTGPTSHHQFIAK